MRISVVGAGSAGCFAALKCAGEHDVRIYEEHLRQPVHCAGLISSSGLNRLGVSLNEDIVCNRVSGARIFSPSGDSFLVDGRDVKAYVVDRQGFDRFLLDSAVDGGAVLVNERVKDIGGLDADRVVLATGVDYRLQRRLGFKVPRRFLVGAQFELDVECDRDLVELHFNVPGFFSWIIPAGDHARVGCCSTENPVPYLDCFVRRLSSEGRLRRSKVFDKVYGIIPMYDPNLRTDYGRVVVVGDAAGHVKASTGGGIVLGGLAAGFVGYPDYGERWRAAIGRELRLHLWIHNFLSRLSAAGMDRLFYLVSEFNGVLEKEGDMDLASQTVSALLRSPSFVARFLWMLPSLLFDMNPDR